MQNTKKGSSTVYEYVLKIRSLAESLIAAGQPVSERDLLMNILEGLGSEFDAVVVSITALQTDLTMGKIKEILLIQIKILEIKDTTMLLKVK
ncbi:hypothetical protein ACOSQ3_026674 [Xanthoceras sorbifolium]